MGKVMYWNFDRIALMIIQMLLNKFDCFIVIEGNRGLGKSTLAYKIAKKVNNYMRIIHRTIGREDMSQYYKFNPSYQLKNPKLYQFILYKREQVINFYNKWHQTAIADEMINVSFNREFWSEDQRNLIKMINMNRDHCNLFLACVPQFQTLDNQIKNLCKIRITVVRRGLAVIQTPNRTIYNKDKWDTANNERIEREWLKRGGTMPQYSKLNTFRGVLKFKALTEAEQKVYDEIKLVERNVIAKEQFGIKAEDDKDEVDKTIDKLLKGEIKNSSVIDGIAFALGEIPHSFKNKLRGKLNKIGKSSQLTSYYWEKKKISKEDLVEEDEASFKQLLE